MNVHLAEVSKFGVLSNNALNLFTDLKDKGVYIKSAKTYFSINSFLDEISNKWFGKDMIIINEVN